MEWRHSPVELVPENAGTTPWVVQLVIYLKCKTGQYRHTPNQIVRPCITNTATSTGFKSINYNNKPHGCQSSGIWSTDCLIFSKTQKPVIEQTGNSHTIFNRSAIVEPEVTWNGASVEGCGVERVQVLLAAPLNLVAASGSTTLSGKTYHLVSNNTPPPSSVV